MKRILTILVGATYSIKVKEISEKGYSVKSVLAGGGVDMDQTQFDRLFIRPDLNHILLSDVDRFLDSLAADYPDVVQVSSIGNSWENRPIRLVTLDARSKFILHPKASEQKPVAAAETKKTSDEKESQKADQDSVLAEKLKDAASSDILLETSEEPKDDWLLT